MDLLTLCIHLTEIPTSPQKFANTVGQNPAPILTLCHRLREGIQKKVFLGDFSQMWVGGVADSQTRSKPLKPPPPNHPENCLF